MHEVKLQEASVIDRAAAGDPAAWQDLVRAYQERLRRMVALRLDPRLRGRVDPSDVVQDAFLDAIGLLEGYRHDPPLPFYLWLRQLAGTRLAKSHRHHLDTLCRDVRREVALQGEPVPDVSSAVLANLGCVTTNTCNASSARPRPRPVCTTPTLSQSSGSVRPPICTFMPCSSSTPWTGSCPAGSPYSARTRGAK